MGGCVSSARAATSPHSSPYLRNKKRYKVKRYFLRYKVKGRRGKISDSPAVIRLVDRSDGSNLTLHLTQVQWHHSELDSENGNVLSQEEAWFDSLSILESDSDDDYSSVNGDFAPTLNANQVGTQILQQTLNPKSDPPQPIDTTADIASKFRLLSNLRISRDAKLEKQERAASSACGTPSCTPRFGNNKISPVPVPVPVQGASPKTPQRRKSAVIRLSFKRRSFEGDQTTEICASKRYLYRPRAGLSVPPGGSWSLLEPSSFKLRSESFFRQLYDLFIICEIHIKAPTLSEIYKKSH
ncbi:hypothetical protein LUZ60_004928 [Juncus effusus]|nr:hypothetical protein LUZ60_004928 [Juncus effusus]